MDIKNSNQQYGPLDGMKASSVENETPKKGSYRMILITAIVMLIGISGYLVLSNDNIKQQLIGKLPFNIPGGGAASDKGSVALPSGNDQSIDRQQPWIDIVNASPGKTYNLSDPIILYVDVSSGGQDITGYDALLTFDKAYFDLVEVSSALPNFQIFKFDNKNHISVTGIKDINDRTQSIFDNTHLLKLTLKPKQKGTSKVGIVTNVGREVTQLVDVNVAVIKPQAGSEEITVN